MAEVIFWRGDTQEIKARPIIDGQLLYNTDTGETFIDVDRRRVALNKNLPEHTASDVGKFLRVNASGKAEWQLVPNAKGVKFGG